MWVVSRLLSAVVCNCHFDDEHNIIHKGSIWKTMSKWQQWHMIRVEGNRGAKREERFNTGWFKNKHTRYRVNQKNFHSFIFHSFIHSGVRASSSKWPKIQILRRRPSSPNASRGRTHAQEIPSMLHLYLSGWERYPLWDSLYAPFIAQRVSNRFIHRLID